YPSNDFDMDGDVDGWNLGLDFWLRFPVTADTSMPLVFRIDYQKKERDGSGDGDIRVSTSPPGGPYDGLVGPLDWDYNSEETLLTITAGGGFDIGVSANTNIAVGLFYNYINSKTDLEMTISPGGGLDLLTETDGYPESSEHQIKLQFAGEHKLSSCLTMRGGLSTFYGWVSEEYDLDGGVDISGLGSASSLLNNSISLDGNRWGIEASLGATWVCERITVEPFINGGYQRVSLDGNEDWSLIGIDALSFDVDKEIDKWFIGGGFSLLFDL
ncbi:MAG: autotransporter domain-containing protein, partial [Deltaproteobacteria bacterium]|nr:autotransporter domain-containing protein [Deltaproteobacteria bacterium]